jgi:hypothetical protein
MSKLLTYDVFQQGRPVAINPQHIGMLRRGDVTFSPVVRAADWKAGVRHVGQVKAFNSGHALMLAKSLPAFGAAQGLARFPMVQQKALTQSAKTATIGG